MIFYIESGGNYLFSIFLKDGRIKTNIKVRKNALTNSEMSSWTLSDRVGHILDFPSRFCICSKYWVFIGRAVKLQH